MNDILDGMGIDCDNVLFMVDGGYVYVSNDETGEILWMGMVH